MKFSVLFFYLAMLPLGALAAETYKLDRPHTQIIFSVNHLGFSHSYGKFLDYDGTFTVDREHPERDAATVTIRTGSLDMGDNSWKEALTGPDYFDSDKYPTMTFKATRVTKTGDQSAKMDGLLTLRGVTRPVALDVHFNKSGRHPFEAKYVAGFSADGVIDRGAFGMTAGEPLVGNDVAIHIEVEGDRVEAPGHDFYNQ